MSEASQPQPTVSVIIVSFNTRDLLRECLQSLNLRCHDIPKQVLVVDNVSRDGSPNMVKQEFPDVELIRSDVNLGFAAANNRAFPLATGRYIVLLNSDAFLEPGALDRAIKYMDADARIGIGGARLIGRDGSWQPSARLFPSPLNDFLTLTGLAARYPRSRVFGRFDRTWADPEETADVDWVPGAFSIVRKSALDKVGYFDERFFLYYEEVDLCRRFKQAGYLVRYWHDVVVTHLGGESSKTVTELKLSSAGSQLALWRLRSEFLYYRKHSRLSGWLSKTAESLWYRLRARRNAARGGEQGTRRLHDSKLMADLIRQAWRETEGGTVCPPRPW